MQRMRGPGHFLATRLVPPTPSLVDEGDDSAKAVPHNGLILWLVAAHTGTKGDRNTTWLDSIELVGWWTCMSQLFRNFEWSLRTKTKLRLKALH